MLKKLDLKYIGEITKVDDNQIVPVSEWVVFRPADNAVLPMLKAYRQECIDIGCDENQLNGIDDLIDRVIKWRLANPDRLKNADTGKLLTL